MRGAMPAADQLQEPLFEILAGGHLADGSGRAYHASIDDRDMRAHFLDKRHHMRGDDHRAACGHVFDEDVLEIGTGDRINRFKRFVEHQNAGAVNHGACEADLLSHSR